MSVSKSIPQTITFTIVILLQSLIILVIGGAIHSNLYGSLRHTGHLDTQRGINNNVYIAPIALDALIEICAADVVGLASGGVTS
jgi:hypothetical protein